MDPVDFLGRLDDAIRRGMASTGERPTYITAGPDTYQAIAINEGSRTRPEEDGAGNEPPSV